MPSLIEKVLAELDLVPDAPDNNECLDRASDLIARNRVGNFTSWWEEIQRMEVEESDVVRLQQKLREIIQKPVSEDCIATAIWALGKSHDSALRPYFMSLISRYIDPPHYDILHQSIVAIDNFEDIIMRYGDGGLSSFEPEKIAQIARRMLADEGGDDGLVEMDDASSV